MLLGRYPSAELETARQLVPVPPPIPVGLPSDLLERRPDLQAAERRVAAAFFEQEEARLTKLPRFTLTAAVGGGNTLSETIGSLGAGLFAPLFTFWQAVLATLVLVVPHGNIGINFFQDQIE